MACFRSTRSSRSIKMRVRLGGSGSLLLGVVRFVGAARSSSWREFFEREGAFDGWVIPSTAWGRLASRASASAYMARSERASFVRRPRRARLEGRSFEFGGAFVGEEISSHLSRGFVSLSFVHWGKARFLSRGRRLGRYIGDSVPVMSRSRLLSLVSGPCLVQSPCPSIGVMGEICLCAIPSSFTSAPTLARHVLPCGRSVPWVVAIRLWVFRSAL